MCEKMKKLLLLCLFLVGCDNQPRKDLFVTANMARFETEDAICYRDTEGHAISCIPKPVKCK